MAEPTCGCQPGDVSTETVAKTVDAQIASLDPQRAAAFTGLQTIRAARAAGYTREQARLALKHGADSPRVAALADKARFNTGLRRDLQFELARSQTEVPSVDKDGYVFHGFVRDLAGQAVPRLTLALYDEQGNWIQALGYGCTDERGYFILRYQPGKNGADAVNRAPASFQLNPTGGSPAAAKIHVLDAKQTTLQIEKQPLYPQPGEVDFRLIILGADSAPCTPPTTSTKPGDPAPATPTTTPPTPSVPIPTAPA